MKIFIFFSLLGWGEFDQKHAKDMFRYWEKSGDYSETDTKRLRDFFRRLEKNGVKKNFIIGRNNRSCPRDSLMLSYCKELKFKLDNVLRISNIREKNKALNAWFAGCDYPFRDDFIKAKQVLMETEASLRRLEEEEKRKAAEMVKEYDRLGEKARQLLDGILREKDDSKKYQALRNWLAGFGKTLFPFPDDYERAKEAFVEVERRIKEAENQRKPDLDKARFLLEEFRKYCGSAGTRLDQFLNGKRFRRDGKTDKNDIPPIVDRNLNISSDLPIDSVEFKILIEIGNPIQGFQTDLKEAFVMQMREAGKLLSSDYLTKLKSLRESVHTQFLLFLKSEGVRLPTDCERFIRKSEEDKR